MLEHFPHVGEDAVLTNQISNPDFLLPSLRTDKDLARLHSSVRMAGFHQLLRQVICFWSPSSHLCILGMHHWRSEVCVFTFPTTAKCCDLCARLIWTSPLVYSNNLSAQRMSVRLGIKDSCLQSLAVIPRSSESVWGLLTSLQWHTLKFLLGSPSIYTNETSISIFSP